MRFLPENKKVDGEYHPLFINMRTHAVTFAGIFFNNFSVASATSSTALSNAASLTLDGLR